MKNVKLLLIAGNEGSGKTTTCKKVDKILKENGYENVDDYKLPSSDYCICRQKDNTAVFICTASDTQSVINQFIDFIRNLLPLLKNVKNIILITAARNEGDNMRDYLIQTLGDVVNIQEQIELPLARIHKKSDAKVQDWYQASVKNLLKHILSNKPFNLN